MTWIRFFIRIGTHDLSLLELHWPAAASPFSCYPDRHPCLARPERAARTSASKPCGAPAISNSDWSTLAGQLRNFTDQSVSAQAQMTDTLDHRLDHVNRRLGASLNDQAERTGRVRRQLHERLAVIDTPRQSRRAFVEMISLKDILSNKQARGAYGQGRMEAIVRDGLHGMPIPSRRRSRTERAPIA